MHRRLYRSDKDRILFGVAGGLAQYVHLDPALVRLIIVLITFATGGMAILFYLVLAIIMPKEETSATEPREILRENVQSIVSETTEAGRRVGEAFRGGATTPETGDEPPPEAPGSTSAHNTLGWVLIALGVILLLVNLGWWWFDWGKFWPLVLIAIGIAISVGRARRS